MYAHTSPPRSSHGYVTACTFDSNFKPFRLVELVDAVALTVKLPAVVRAADALFFVASKEERRRAVRAGVLDQRNLPRTSHGSRSGFPPAAAGADRRTIRRFDFFRQQRRHPVLPQKVAHDGTGARHVRENFSFSSTLSIYWAPPEICVVSASAETRSRAIRTRPANGTPIARSTTASMSASSP